MTISNITIDGVSVPIFLRLGNRARPFTPDGPKPAVGTFRNVTHQQRGGHRGRRPSAARSPGLPGHRVENVTLSDIRIQFAGGGAAKLAAKAVPEHETKYPESRMFGTLPAYGLYCRHVHGLKFST